MSDVVLPLRSARRETPFRHRLGARLGRIFVLAALGAWFLLLTGSALLLVMLGSALFG